MKNTQQPKPSVEVTAYLCPGALPIPLHCVRKNFFLPKVVLCIFWPTAAFFYCFPCTKSHICCASLKWFLRDYPWLFRNSRLFSKFIYSLIFLSNNFLSNNFSCSRVVTSFYFKKIIPSSLMFQVSLYKNNQFNYITKWLFQWLGRTESDGNFRKNPGSLANWQCGLIRLICCHGS